MDRYEQIACKIVCVLIKAGYKIDYGDINAVLKALSDYEEKHNAMLEHILLEK